MQVTATKQPKGLVKLTIELPAADFTPFITRAVQSLASQTKIAGFRPGMAPRDIVEKKVGHDALMQEAAGLAVQNSYAKAVAEQKLRTIGGPNISVEKLAEGNPFIFSAEVPVLPEIKVGDIATIKVERKPVEVTNEQIEKTLKSLQLTHASHAAAKRPAKHGDRVDVDFDVALGNVPLENGKGTNQTMTIGEQMFIPGFEEQLIGLEADQEKTFKLTFPKEYGKKDLQGKEAEFKVKLRTVYDTSMPLLDDAFAKKLGDFESMEKLREKVKENLHEESADRERQRYEQAILEELLKKSTIDDVPTILVESEQDKMVHELQHAIEHDGGKFEDYLSSLKKTRDDLKKEFVKRAEDRVKVALLLRHIADDHSLVASTTEVEGEISAEKLRLGSNPELLKQVDSEDYKNYLKMVLTNRKTIAWILEKLEGSM
ncbi:MAG: trigger factor [bacterium]|nr:trigger factor [bacterium]